MIDYTSELILYQKTGKSFTPGPYKAWTLEEHKKFHEAIKKFEVTDHHSISTYIGSRNNEQVDSHLRIYRNYCNKQYPSATAIPTTISAVPIITLPSAASTTTTIVVSTPSTTPVPSTPSTPTTVTSPLITPVSPLTNTSNTFLSNITNNLFKNLIDQLDKEPNINQNMARGKASTSATATAGTAGANKISLHLASHAIPVSMVPPQINATASNNKTSTATSTTTTTTTNSGRKNKNSLNTNLVNDSKLKKNQKLLSEPWTDDDQKKLSDALAKYPSSRYSSVSRWQVISKELGISPKTVALRYNQMLINLYPKQEESENDEEDEDTPPPPSTGKRKSSAKKAATTRSTKRGKKGQEDTQSSSDLDLNSSSDGGLPPPPMVFSPLPPSTPLLEQPKREPTIHHLNFDPIKADSLLQRNTHLIDQIRNDIIYTGSTKIDLLNQYKNNINEALKCTMIWSDNSQEMPPLPVKINDMIIGLMGMKSNLNNQNNNNNDQNNQNNQNNNNNNHSLDGSGNNNFSSLSTSSSSGKWSDLPKVANEWFLPLEEDSTTL
ncbi:myb domain-containing protein [Cavenderia fasciculata]|uniref:Myb domain-containing protein n=1 Tax=Cavenderia fasciculata TaxID=261658 RepID=F4Q205_CACFS|nr:myb domain-containing protein [Cavenderia fasciculata]EGG18025.1 myb domain-containing protein [Cavenderia fasciculata]|eukprot:XP_004356918.1 myb domain-containing protein [Cavenderia fasciculata]